MARETSLWYFLDLELHSGVLKWHPSDQVEQKQKLRQNLYR